MANYRLKGIGAPEKSQIFWGEEEQTKLLYGIFTVNSVGSGECDDEGAPRVVVANATTTF